MIINANDAKRKTKKEGCMEELKNIEVLILEAIKLGYYNIKIEQLTSNAIDKLMELGYQVTYMGSFGNCGYKISW